MRVSRLWCALGFTIAFSFAVLGYYGVRIAREAPPIPRRVVTENGTVLFTAEDILRGQNVWQSAGGQQLGTVWGHGAYVAPDWSADWLHRQCVYMLEHRARERFNRAFDELDAESQAALLAWLREQLRTNRYDPATGDLLVTSAHAEAIRALSRYYDTLFSDAREWPSGVEFLADGGYDPARLRDAYAMPDNVVPDPERRRALTAFFCWAAWVCAAERPVSGEQSVVSADKTRPSYTMNWPPEPLVGNRPTGAAIVWSVISFVLLLAGVGLLAWYYAAATRESDENGHVPEQDPLLALNPTPSMRATLKYFWLVSAMFVAQIGLGAVTAHYGVEGQGFYGFPLSRWLPYAVTRTWHVQLGILWIATAWLATGLFIAPAVSGREPRGQKLGVDLLFIALGVVLLGVLGGTWLGTRQRLSLEANFWFGHQGYEYVDLGRLWQVLLFVGLLFWLFLMLRALWPALREKSQQRHLLVLLVVSSAAIGGFYAAGLMWGRQTHLTLVEYWRWWVVHLWVEGFFEVFATTVIAFLFVRMGLLSVDVATRAVLFSSTVFLFGGIIGTFHHLYFAATPPAVLALGATFSALEVVPLVLMGFEAYENLTLARVRPWVQAYRWPIYFFVAVAFWNLVGAGLFGFFINPPIALYYMQGLNTTPVHGHTALFGVYGMLGLGLTLFCVKGLWARARWKTAALAYSFWAMNIGLALMVLLSLLPVGLLQTLASVERGLWFARSAEFQQQGILEVLRWMRIVGDTVFATGALAFGWFILGCKFGWSLDRSAPPDLPGDREPMRGLEEHSDALAGAGR